MDEKKTSFLNWVTCKTGIELLEKSIWPYTMKATESWDPILYTNFWINDFKAIWEKDNQSK